MKIKFTSKVEIGENNQPETWYGVYIDGMCYKKTRDENEAKAFYNATVDIYRGTPPAEQTIEETEIQTNEISTRQP